MSITNVVKDPASRTLTITTEYDAVVERVWQLWADPRQLERWWGPPEFPATVVEHDLQPGGDVSFYVTGSDGDRRHGWWRVLAVEAPHRLEFELADPEIPTMTVRVTVESREGTGTRMVIETTFPSGSAMDQLLGLGFEEGFTTALGQIDALL